MATLLQGHKNTTLHERATDHALSTIANKTLARDNYRGDHHLAATPTPHSDCRASQPDCRAIFVVLVIRRVRLEVGARQVVEQNLEAGAKQILPALPQMAEQRGFVWQHLVQT